MDVHKNISERFEIGVELGRGAYGRVFKAIPRESGDPVALKRGVKVLSDKIDAQRTLREVVSLHSNVLSIAAPHCR